ncbi:hypothetical protein AAW14_00710 [Streptomyces hygroscopicus]|uniref:hypothetical protein n=1 Tax=Streptomyces hygroscopicus TaxID=1912 RepID=UPI00223EADA9|nr:hypothetical protein [Streptomyces hygroscopicus]MCW7940611.1 hypothetical protein [Streptomyces hygroscopicus]
MVVVAIGTLPCDEAVARRTELGEASAIALSTVSEADADAVRGAIGDAHSSFVPLIRMAKA